jgi:hypothetical protein
MITELRTYTIKRGMMESWIELWEDAARHNVDEGIRVEFAGFVPDSMGTFIWLRSFRDESDRQRREANLYGSDWWRDVGDHFMSHVVNWEATVLETAFVRNNDQEIERVLGSTDVEALFSERSG